MSKFKDWKDVVGHNITFDSREVNNDSFVHLIDGKNFQLSPATKLLFDTWTSIINLNKNLILIYPDDILRPLSLLAYFYSKIKNKSTLAFTSGNIGLSDDNISHHNKNYCLCRWHGSDFLFYDIPLGYIKNKDLYSNLFLPHTSSNFKKRIRDDAQNALCNSKTKIILNGLENYTFISNVINKIYLDDNIIEYPKDEFETDIGCIIFENASRFINSDYKTNKFINWIKKNSPKNTKFLFHFSNLSFNNRNIEKLKINTNSIVLNFEKNILLHNEFLKQDSINYFDNKSKYELDILNNYNLDKKSDYESLMDFGLVNGLKKGNIDYFFKYAISIAQKINQETLKNRLLYGQAFRLLYDLPNIMVNPSFYRIRFSLFSRWNSMTVLDFLDFYEGKIENETEENQFLIKNFISNIKNIYIELSKTKRFNEGNSYTRIGKEYLACVIAENPSKFFKKDCPLILATLNKFEVGVLKEKVHSYDVKVIHLKELINSNTDFSDYNLLISGKIPSKYMPALFKDFKEILFLNYEGKNRESILRQINKFTSKDLYQYSKEYYDEFYDFFEKDSDEYVEFFEGKELMEEEKRIFVPRFNKGNNKGDFERNYGDSNYDDSSIAEYNYVESIEVELLNIKTHDIVTKKLPLNRKYLHFKNIEKLEDSSEDSVIKIKPKEFIILLDNSKGFRELFKEIFFPNNEIDFDLASYWIDRIDHFCKENNLSPENFLDIYKENGGDRGIQTIKKWLKGEIISPNEIQLKILGNTIGDEFLINNTAMIFKECRKIRSLNIQIGRKIGHLIRNIIKEDLNFSDLSYEEELMYDYIKNNIYQLISFVKD